VTVSEGEELSVEKEEAVGTRLGVGGLEGALVSSSSIRISNVLSALVYSYRTNYFIEHTPTTFLLVHTSRQKF
jgi:phage tail tape-measure protein